MTYTKYNSFGSLYQFSAPLLRWTGLIGGSPLSQLINIFTQEQFIKYSGTSVFVHNSLLQCVLSPILPNHLYP